MGGGREGKGREGEREGRSSLRARFLAAGIGGRVGWGGAVRDLARRLDLGRVLLLSTVFFLLTFIKFLTQNKDIWKRMHSRKKKGGKRTCAKKQAKFMIRHLSLLRINFSTL